MEEYHTRQIIIAGNIARFILLNGKITTFRIKKYLFNLVLISLRLNCIRHSTEQKHKGKKQDKQSPAAFCSL